jgi:hypothetical protein
MGFCFCFFVVGGGGRILVGDQRQRGKEKEHTSKEIRKK